MATKTNGDVTPSVSLIRDRFESANSSFESLTGDVTSSTSVSMNNVQSPTVSGDAKQIPPKTKPKPSTTSNKLISMDEEATAIITRLNNQIWLNESGSSSQRQHQRSNLVVEDEVFTPQAAGGSSNYVIDTRPGPTASKVRPLPAVRPRNAKPSVSAASSPSVDAPFDRSATGDGESTNAASSNNPQTPLRSNAFGGLKPEIETGSFDMSSSSFTIYAGDVGAGRRFPTSKPTVEVPRVPNSGVGTPKQERRTAFEICDESQADRQVRRPPVAAKRTQTINEAKLKPPVAARRSSSLRSYSPAQLERNAVATPEGTGNTGHVVTVNDDTQPHVVTAVARQGSNRGPPPPPPTRRTPINAGRSTVNNVPNGLGESGCAGSGADGTPTGSVDVDRVRRRTPSGDAVSGMLSVTKEVNDDVNNNITLNKINNKRVDVVHHQNNLQKPDDQSNHQQLSPSLSLRSQTKLTNFIKCDEHRGTRDVSPEERVVDKDDDVNAGQSHDVAGNRNSYVTYGELVGQSFTFLDDFDDTMSQTVASDSSALQVPSTATVTASTSLPFSTLTDDVPGCSFSPAQSSSSNSIRFTSSSHPPLDEPSSSSISNHSCNFNVSHQPDERTPIASLRALHTAPAIFAPVVYPPVVQAPVAQAPAVQAPPVQAPAVQNDHIDGADCNRKSYIVYKEFVGENFTFLEDFENEKGEASLPLPPPLSDNSSDDFESADESISCGPALSARSSSPTDDRGEDCERPRDIVIVRPGPDNELYKRASVGQLEAIATVSSAFRFLDFSDSV